MTRGYQLFRFFQSEKGRAKLDCLAASASKDIRTLLKRLPIEGDRSPREWVFRTLFPSVHREWTSKVEAGNIYPIPAWPPEPSPPEENCAGYDEAQKD